LVALVAPSALPVLCAGYVGAMTEATYEFQCLACFWTFCNLLPCPIGSLSAPFQFCCGDSRSRYFSSLLPSFPMLASTSTPGRRPFFLSSSSQQHPQRYSLLHLLSFGLAIPALLCIGLRHSFPRRHHIFDRLRLPVRVRVHHDPDANTHPKFEFELPEWTLDIQPLIATNKVLASTEPFETSEELLWCK